MMSLFQLHAPYKPAGDQPQAIAKMVENLRNQQRFQTLLGVTGSGKTFTLANAIAQSDRPVLVLSHNKTLAAQLYSEFKAFFPENAVEYFISYYDYYLPESYIPQTDTYIAKDASINENIEKLRLAATASLVERRDVIVVASVSCIYGLGSPDDYADLCVRIEVGDTTGRDEILRRLVDIQYARNDASPEKGEFRVRGDVIDVYEPQRDDYIRVSFFGDEIESIERRDVVSGKVKTRPKYVTMFPCKHFVLPPERIQSASDAILAEMADRVGYFERNNLLVEAQRLYQRVTYDLEMMKEIGYCSGIENYSMYLANRRPGSRPYCLLDFFPRDFLTVIDESHVTLPQLQAMYRADRNRKQVLVDHGFRLPSALENRPLQFEEFERLTGDTIFVSATPGEFELSRSGAPVELIVRPTGLLDPVIEIRPLEGQVDDVIAEVRRAAAAGERTLVTTLTKKASERLADYLAELGIKAAYLHSELDALERVRVLNKLRDGDFDCVIGINLLREGIDLPEVAVVAILDADKEGFLRSERSLVQTAGRAARNKAGRAILYADNVTPSMQKLIDQTNARRERQMAYNKEHGIVPETIRKGRNFTIGEIVAPDSGDRKKSKMPKLAGTMFTDATDISELGLSETDLDALINELTGEMRSAAEALEFERAADLRDQIRKLRPPRKDA
ncbi:excinuclease ABC subunit UvrB [Victivallaceae bacterium BBE-744-WT-12]|uniref:UvrABC system protein B n=2 Tax=Victivallis lenta TaxID=2606640 RepID=A0A844FZK2_9BACT|nr:excinuclease ABC subunit B [Victivallales bacterium CCUG 44730]MBS5532297.1 excinuclease ABC subunit UvrB [bacterium]MST96343.1 excinuclease ABC subunit UvrB [Victivallis lenta]